MEYRLKKVSNIVFLAVIFSIFSSASWTIFKNDWNNKVVYLSSSSCKFLKTVVPEFEKWLSSLKQTSNPQENSLASYRIEILQYLRCFRNNDKVCGKDIDQLGLLFLNAQTALNSNIKNNYFGEKNKSLHKLIKEIGVDISTAVRQVYIGTAKSELKVIDNYLRFSDQEYAAQVYDLILGILKHFDAVAVTEYDFTILSTCALFVLFSIE